MLIYRLRGEFDLGCGTPSGKEIAQVGHWAEPKNGEEHVSVLTETYMLSNGVLIPKVGLGTWEIDDYKAAEAVRNAIEVGYRSVDTASVYGNERGVGEGIRTAGIDREELFVTTKLPAETKDYPGAVADIDKALKTMGLDYLDLLLIHSPQPWSDFRGGDYFEGNLET